MATLEERIASGSWTMGVVGLGYVGLPLAVAAVDAGMRAIGFDVNQTYVEMLSSGESPIETCRPSNSKQPSRAVGSR